MTVNPKNMSSYYSLVPNRPKKVANLEAEWAATEGWGVPLPMYRKKEPRGVREKNSYFLVNSPTLEENRQVKVRPVNFQFQSTLTLPEQRMASQD